MKEEKWTMIYPVLVVGLAWLCEMFWLHTQ
jgi:hypothetical protein